MSIVAESGAALEQALLYEGVAVYRDRLRTGGRFALEMAYCGERGIPHSHFLGGPLRWTREDQDKALAWHLVRAEVCGGCGTFPDEWTDAETGVAVPMPPYVPEAVHCWGCAEIAGFMAEIRKSGADTDGVTVRLRRYDPDVDDMDG